MNTPRTNEVALNPADYGLPTRKELRKLRIWDIHYHGLWEGDLKKHEETMVYVERMGIERVLSLDIAGTPADPLGKLLPDEKKKEIRKFLETNSDRVWRAGSGDRLLTPCTPVLPRLPQPKFSLPTTTINHVFKHPPSRSSFLTLTPSFGLLQQVRVHTPFFGIRPSWPYELIFCQQGSAEIYDFRVPNFPIFKRCCNPN